MKPLSEREKIILGAVVQNFILNATPVSSSLIARKHVLGFSPATIRNIMGVLEQKGYIYQPHPSAGRVPTSSGYRVYVDNLMPRGRLTSLEKEKIRDTIQHTGHELEDVMREATRILAHLSHQLSVVVTPRMDRGIFHRMEIVSLSSERILIIITIQSGLIKTLTLEIDSQISRQKLELVSQVLNERLHGMRLGEIRKRFREIVKDIKNEESGLVRMFLQTADQIFDFEDDVEVFFMGTHNIVQQPEFSDVHKFSSVVELLENRDIIIHLLDWGGEKEPVTIKIGEEIKERRMQQCSIITARYEIGKISGTLSIIGPMRMNYSKIISLVNFTARTISGIFESN